MRDVKKDCVHSPLEARGTKDGVKVACEAEVQEYIALVGLD